MIPGHENLLTESSLKLLTGFRFSVDWYAGSDDCCRVYCFVVHFAICCCKCEESKRKIKDSHRSASISYMKMKGPHSVFFSADVIMDHTHSVEELLGFRGPDLGQVFHPDTCP
jgi:hypothetical protein